MPFFQLPREIITFIFQNLLRNRSEKKIAYLLICKRLYFIVLPLFYCEMRLQDSDMLFLGLGNMGENLIHVRHLLLDLHTKYPVQRLPHYHNDGLHHEVFHTTYISEPKYISRFGHLFKSTRHLQSLTYVHRGHTTQAALFHILRSIRHCVLEHLELDFRYALSQPTLVSDDDPSTWPQHLCTSLNDMLYDIPHIRLRLARICPRIFRQKYERQKLSRLETLVIDLLDDEQQMICFHCCRDGYSDSDRCLVKELQQSARFIIADSPRLRRLNVITNDMQPWGTVFTGPETVVKLLHAPQGISETKAVGKQNSI